MTHEELINLLNHLRALPDETPWVEFKQNRYEPQELGEYLSALANSACLESEPRGFLVFGIQDATHDIVGTRFNPERAKAKGNQALLMWLHSGLRPNVGFDCDVLETENGPVVLFSVGAAIDQPVRFLGIAWVRIGSNKTKLDNHSELERRIWLSRTDWSALICDSAELEDLDPRAITKARQEYAKKSPHQASDVKGWDDLTFLNKARITIRGKITNAALVLLGRREAAGLLSPAVAQITWVLRDEKNQEQDYKHFEPPFLLAVDELAARIRNLTVRAMPGGTLFPVELSQYDPWVLREALHNCIAHQDYTRGARINVIEFPDRLLFKNVGSFLPGTVEDVVFQDSPPAIYRNPFLAGAMVHLNMIDTQGGGIKRMFFTQAGRYFPLPDYDLSYSNQVRVAIQGTILDERYSKLLMEQSDLDIDVVMLLDRVQKRIRIGKDEASRLRRMGLVEGRYPNLIVAGWIAKRTDKQAEHIRKRGFDNQYYRDMLLKLIKEHGPVGPHVINELLMKNLPDALTEKQKQARIRNLVYDLAHRRELIVNVGSSRGSGALWIIKKGSLTNNEESKLAS